MFKCILIRCSHCKGLLSVAVGRSVASLVSLQLTVTGMVSLQSQVRFRYNRNSQVWCRYSHRYGVVTIDKSQVWCHYNWHSQIWCRYNWHSQVWCCCSWQSQARCKCKLKVAGMVSLQSQTFLLITIIGRINPLVSISKLSAMPWWYFKQFQYGLMFPCFHILLYTEMRLNSWPILLHCLPYISSLFSMVIKQCCF